MNEKNNNDYNNKNERTNNVFLFLIIYLIVSFLFDFLFLVPATNTETTTEEQVVEEEIVEEETYSYLISYHKGDISKKIKTNEYEIENGLLKTIGINYDGSTTNYVLHVDNYSIKYMDYTANEDFKPKYHVSYYNGSFGEYMYCDSVEYQEDNSIIITTNNKKVHLYGNYEVKELSENEINEWLEKHTTQETIDDTTKTNEQLEDNTLEENKNTKVS